MEVTLTSPYPVTEELPGRLKGTVQLGASVLCKFDAIHDFFGPQVHLVPQNERRCKYYRREIRRRPKNRPPITKIESPQWLKGIFKEGTVKTPTVLNFLTIPVGVLLTPQIWSVRSALPDCHDCFTVECRWTSECSKPWFASINRKWPLRLLACSKWQTFVSIP